MIRVLAAVSVFLAAQAHALKSGDLYEYCNHDSKEVKGFCNGFFVGTLDAHLSAQIAKRHFDGEPLCFDWTDYSAGQLKAYFEMLYRSEELSADQDPAYYLMGKVFREMTCAAEKERID